MRLKLIFILLLSFSFHFSFCQNTKKPVVIPDIDSMMKNEKILHVLGDSIRDGSNEFVRMDALFDFVPLLVRTLKFEGSFNYPFDSLDFMHKIMASDNSFRILNWILKFDDGTYRYYGAIQLNTNGPLKLIPLRDKSNSIEYDQVEDTTLTSDSWLGMEYYDMFDTKIRGQKYYILFGWDGNNVASHRKIIDVMYFKNGNAYFGAPLFKVGDKQKTRFILHFAGNALVSIKYHPEKKLIVFDHLVPPDSKSEGKPWTYVPDGSYDYFHLKKGKFIFGKDVFKKYRINTGGPE